jgi:hypothetical protein
VESFEVEEGVNSEVHGAAHDVADRKVARRGLILIDGDTEIDCPQKSPR